MTKSPIYEQVSGGNPDEPFVPSGLYALAGYVIGKRFVAATLAGPLHSMDQWLTLGRQPPPAPVPRRPVYEELCDAAVAYWRRHMQAPPRVAAGAWWPEVPPAPATLDLVCQRRAARGR